MRRHRRYILNGLAALSLTLCGATVFSWLQDADEFGRINVDLSTGPSPTPLPAGARVAAEAPRGSRSFYVYEYPLHDRCYVRTPLGGSLPFIPVVALTAALPAWRLAAAAWCLYHAGRRHRLPADRCPTCHYDLRATPARCPECGLTPGPPHTPPAETPTPRC